jgi:hypothetical protein
VNVDPWHLLAWSVVIGSTAPGVAIVVRALSAVEKLVLEGKRPWACDVCLSWWMVAATTLVAGLAAHDLEVLWAAGPAYPLAYKLLGWLSQPVSSPGFPELAELPAEPAALVEPSAPAEPTEEPEEPVRSMPEGVDMVQKDGKTFFVKRKRGRPRKNPLPEGAL